MLLSKVEADRLKKIASVAAIFLAVLLSLLKVFGAWYTDSLSVLSSMIDSMSDVFGSLVTLVAVRFSALPASDKYRYGYGKSEALSALFQAAFIAGSGLFVMWDGFNRLFHPREIVETGVGIYIMIFAIFSTLVLVSYQRYVFKKTKSQAILADSAHYVVDILTNSAVIISLIFVKMFDAVVIDAIIAVLISAYLLFNAYCLAKEAICLLLDRELSADTRKNIEKLVLENGFVRGIHDLRTRDIGGVYTFEFHLELDGNLKLVDAHNYAHMVEEKILHKYKNAQVTIHQEPAGIKDNRLDESLK